MRKQLYPATMLTLLLTVLLGLIYPFAITGVAQVLFPWQASGSPMIEHGHLVGSALIGQPFADPKYFWGRPSATSPQAYNGASSSGSNLAPTNQALLDAVKQRVADLKAADPGNAVPIPVDLVTASGSGLDPHISPAAALYQVPRVARVRKMSAETVRQLVQKHTEGRQIGILGEPRVNVLELNLALDRSK
ncbi:MAG TPA: potassium-transporting ATPase subunit KdpC [bacterium]|nr:potassium-transporting ATPase subunit KdpC [bacterium]